MSAQESEPSRLPFEPNKKRQKPSKVSAKPVVKTEEPPQKLPNQPPFTKEEMAIPPSSKPKNDSQSGNLFWHTYRFRY